MLIRGSHKTESNDINVDIKDTIFTENVSSSGIKLEDSAKATLRTERCEMTNNDMYLIFASSADYHDEDSIVVGNRAVS